MSGGSGGKRALEAEKRRQYDDDDIGSPGYLRSSGGSSGKPSFPGEKDGQQPSVEGGNRKGEGERTPNRRSAVGDGTSSGIGNSALNYARDRRDADSLNPMERREEKSKPVGYGSRGALASGDGWRTPTRTNGPPAALQRSPQQHQSPVRYPTTIRTSSLSNNSPLPEKRHQMTTTSSKHKLVASPVPKAKYRTDASARATDSHQSKKEKRSLRSTFPDSPSALEKLRHHDHVGVFEDVRVSDHDRDRKAPQSVRERNSTPEAQRLPASDLSTNSRSVSSSGGERRKPIEDNAESWRSIVEASVSPQRESATLPHIARSPQRLTSATVSRMLEGIAATPPPRAPVSASVSPQRASEPATDYASVEQPLRGNEGGTATDSVLFSYGRSANVSSRSSVSPQKISAPQSRSRPTLSSCTDHIPSTVRPLHVGNLSNSANDSVLSFSNAYALQTSSLGANPDNQFSVTSPPLRAAVSPRMKPATGAGSTHASQSSSAPGSPANHGVLSQKSASDSSRHANGVSPPTVLGATDRVISPMTTLGPVQADSDENVLHLKKQGGLVARKGLHDPYVPGTTSTSATDGAHAASSAMLQSQGGERSGITPKERTPTGNDADTFPQAPMLTGYDEEERTSSPPSPNQAEVHDDDEATPQDYADDVSYAPQVESPPKLSFIQASSSAAFRVNYSGFYNDGNECYACSVLTFLLRNDVFTSALKVFLQQAVMISKACRQDGWNCRAREAERASKKSVAETSGESGRGSASGPGEPPAGSVSRDDNDKEGDEQMAKSEEASSIPELSASERKLAGLPLHIALNRSAKKMAHPDEIVDGIDLDPVANLLEGDFFNGVQQDAHEFFVAVTAMLEDEVLAFWKQHTRHKHEMESFGDVWINAVMQGKLLNIIYCANASCGHTIVTTEPYINISLAIPQPKNKKREEEEKEEKSSAAKKESMACEGEQAIDDTDEQSSLALPQQLPTTARDGKTTSEASGTSSPSTTQLLKSSLACEPLDAYVCDSCKSSKEQYQLGCFFSNPPKLLTLQVKRFLASFNAKQGIFTSKKNRSPIDLNHNITILSIPSELYDREGGTLSSPFVAHLSGVLHSSSASSSSSSESHDQDSGLQTSSSSSSCCGSVDAIETHYRLQSVVLHIGRSMNCGHYVAEYAEKREEDDDEDDGNDGGRSRSRTDQEARGSEETTRKRPRESGGEDDSELTVMQVLSMRAEKKNKSEESEKARVSMDADEFFNENGEPQEREGIPCWEWFLANDEAICRPDQRKVDESHRSCSEAYLLLYEKVHERRVQVPVSRFFSSLPPRTESFASPSSPLPEVKDEARGSISTNGGNDTVKEEP